LRIGTTEIISRGCGNRKDVESADKIYKKQTLESLTPGILGPSSPTELEKNHKFEYEVLCI